MSAGRTDWIAVGMATAKERARRAILVRLGSRDAAPVGAELPIGGVGPDFARAAANLVCRLPLIAIDHPAYRQIVSIDFESARTLEAWFMNEPVGAEGELTRRLDWSEGERGGPRETKRRWLEARQELDAVLIRGLNRRVAAGPLDHWELLSRQRLALKSAETGNRAELDELCAAFASFEMEEIFLNGLAGILASEVRRRSGPDQAFVAVLGAVQGKSPLLYAVAEVGATLVSEPLRSALLALAENHREAPEAQLFLEELTRVRRDAEPDSKGSDQRRGRSSYRAFRLARLSGRRFLRHALSAALPQHSASGGSLTRSAEKPDDDRT